MNIIFPQMSIDSSKLTRNTILLSRAMAYLFANIVSHLREMHSFLSGSYISVSSDFDELAATV